MPSLEIAVAQPAFQNHLGTLRNQTSLHGKVISSPFLFGNEKKLSSAWKSSHVPKMFNINLGHIDIRKGNLLIKAVATLESKSSVQNENAHMDYDSWQTDIDSTPRIDLPEREKLRRIRISKANKGNTPWNKGRKHSPETLQLIKERTRLAMQNPKVKMKLVNLGHAQSEETRVKIGLGVRIGWQRRREKLSLQENCCYEWQNLIAEASRKGYDGEEELQWDSYKILDEQLKEQYIESVEQRKVMRRPKGSKRAPKSLEQRRKISQAISAKWNDPNYRDRVCSALAKYYDASYGPERKPRKKPNDSTESPRRSPAKKKVCDENNFSGSESKNQRLRLRRSKGPMYKDPLASSKMEMIKNIRAQRAAAETKKTEAIERARLLIAEAEKAAMALEVAATKIPVARASLIETRQLIAKAIQFIESIETVQISSNQTEDVLVASNEVVSRDEEEMYTAIGGLTKADSGRVNGTPTSSSQKRQDSLFGSNEVINEDEKELYNRTVGLIEAGNGNVNGTKTLSSTEDKNSGFGKFTLEDMLNGEEGLPLLQDMLNGEDDLPGMSLGGKFTLQDMLDDEEDVPLLQDMLHGEEDVRQFRAMLNGKEDLIKQSSLRNETGLLQPNGNSECNEEHQFNGTKAESHDAEMPSKPVTATKKWVRGRLIEVAEEA